MGQWQELLEVLDRFAAMQRRHGQALERGDLKEVHGWRGQRERLFRLLQKKIAECGGACSADQKVGNELRDRLQQLLVGEQGLAARLKARQGALQQEMLGLRKGRKALQGYRAYGGNVAKPRFLSSKA